MSSVGTYNLVVTHKGYPAIADANFELPEHHLALVTGPNGSGKTTLLKAVSGLKSPDRGNLIISTEGIELTDIYQQRRNVCYVGHNLLFMRHIRVSEHLTLCRRLDDSGLTGTKYKMEIEQALEVFQLQEKRSVPVENLSAGQQRRLGLASAFVRGCNLLCIDEPHASLDDISQDLIDKVIKEQYKQGRSFIIATHNPLRLKDIATHSLLLDNGVCISKELSC